MRPALRRQVARGLRALGVDLRKLGPGALLLTRPEAARRDWPAVEKALTRFAVAEHIASLLTQYRVGCVLDVGANRGQYGLALRRAGYTGHIVSFEPVADVFAELQATAAADGRWTAYPYALGREDGTTTINVVPGTLSSVLTPTRFGRKRYAQLREATTSEVELHRLETIFDDVLPGPADEVRPYLKLDTQGYDLEVFAGLGDRVQDVVAMQAEVSLLQIYEGMPDMAEAVAAYREAGFDITALYPVSRQSATARVLEFDCVMVRASSR
ncbi:MAG TPA: FkbM family methyltransferase [Baekduia sp.]|nr:FkbM family methyltransferase [Baekduia sp.]